MFSLVTFFVPKKVTRVKRESSAVVFYAYRYAQPHRLKRSEKLDPGLTSLSAVENRRDDCAKSASRGSLNSPDSSKTAPSTHCRAAA